MHEPTSSSLRDKTLEPPDWRGVSSADAYLLPHEQCPPGPITDNGMRLRRIPMDELPESSPESFDELCAVDDDGYRSERPVRRIGEWSLYRTHRYRDSRVEPSRDVTHRGQRGLVRDADELLDHNRLPSEPALPRWAPEGESWEHALVVRLRAGDRAAYEEFADKTRHLTKEEYYKQCRQLKIEERRPRATLADDLVAPRTLRRRRAATKALTRNGSTSAPKTVLLPPFERVAVLPTAHRLVGQSDAEVANCLAAVGADHSELRERSFGLFDSHLSINVTDVDQRKVA